MKTEIEFKIGEKKMIFDSISNTVIYFTKNGVCIEAEVPKDWELIRIFKFMESLMKASL